jgi:hypothetical protein
MNGCCYVDEMDTVVHNCIYTLTAK